MGGSSSSQKISKDELWKHRNLSMTLTARERSPPGHPAPVSSGGIKTWTEHYRDNIDMRDYISPAQQRYPPYENFNRKVHLWLGDISTLEVDAIVNSAQVGTNPETAASSVSQRITQRAGDYYKAECRQNWIEEPCQAMVTSGYSLPAKYVFNTLLPRSRDPAALRQCYNSCLMKAKHIMVKSIAFPCIADGASTKKNAISRDGAAMLAAVAVREWLKEKDNFKNIDKIIFCVENVDDFRSYTQVLQEVFPVNLSMVETSFHSTDREGRHVIGSQNGLGTSHDRRDLAESKLPRNVTSKEAFHRLVGGREHLVKPNPQSQSPDSSSVVQGSIDVTNSGDVSGNLSSSEAFQRLVGRRGSPVQSNGDLQSSSQSDDSTSLVSKVQMRKPRRIATMYPRDCSPTSELLDPHVSHSSIAESTAARSSLETSHPTSSTSVTADASDPVDTSDPADTSDPVDTSSSREPSDTKAARTTVSSLVPENRSSHTDKNTVDVTISRRKTMM